MTANEHRNFIRSASVLAMGSFLAKAIGAFYRIPLTNLLGGYGMGLYQMAYPLFCLLLTLSSSGIPSALSRLVSAEVARGGDGRPILRSALKTFFLFGLAGTLIMVCLAQGMAAVQGEAALVSCYIALAPSVALVAAIAVLRGYFQGRRRMFPTAMSELCEQCVKVSLGLFFAYRFSYDPRLAVCLALWAVTASEAVALVLLLYQTREGRRPALVTHSASGGEIFRSALPAIAATVVLPLSQMLDSVIIVRLLNGENAVSLYGLYAGSCMSLVNLPVGLVYGFAAASVPAVSEACALKRPDVARKRAMSSLAYTLALALPCATGLFAFAPLAVRLLYPALASAEKEILVSLIRLSAPTVLLLSGVQTLTSCLTGMGRAKFAALGMAVAVAAKLWLQFRLISDPVLSIRGAAISADVCFTVAFFVDLFYTLYKGERHDHDRKFGSRKKRLDEAGGRGDPESGQSASPHGAYELGGNAQRGGDRL